MTNKPQLDLGLGVPAETAPTLSGASLESAATRVHTYHHSIMAYARKHRTTPKRLGIIKARLREGFTETELCEVCDIVSQLPFWRGENDRNRPYDDVYHIFRSKDRVLRVLGGGYGTPGAGNGVGDNQALAATDKPTTMERS